VLYHDDLVTVFRDAHPAASTHILIVPNRHIESLNDLLTEDEILCGHMLLVARELAGSENILAGGYSLTINTGLHAGQTVFHLHLHLKSNA
jgi:histidine triad (HIT) family protein